MADVYVWVAGKWCRARVLKGPFSDTAHALQIQLYIYDYEVPEYYRGPRIGWYSVAMLRLSDQQRWLSDSEVGASAVEGSGE